MTYDDVSTLKFENKPFYEVIQRRDNTIYIMESKDYGMILDYGFWDPCNVDKTPEQALLSYIERTKDTIKMYENYLSEANKMLEELRAQKEN